MNTFISKVIVDEVVISLRFTKFDTFAQRMSYLITNQQA